MVSSSDGSSEFLHEPGRAADPSGVHARVEPRSADAWRRNLEAEHGEVSPVMESMLAAYEALDHRVRSLRAESLAASAVLERLSLSVHVVTEDGVVFANAAARKLERSGIVKRENDRLECAGFEAKEELAEAIREAQRNGRVRRAFVLIRDRKPRLNGLVLSAGRRLPGGAIVVLSDPSHPHEADAEVYSRHFGFTPAEGRVAERLAVGLTARDIAEQLGIGVETVRTHVKSILRKMGTNRQIDAVRTLVTGPLLLG